MLCHESWTFEFEGFDGGWALSDCGDARDDDALALCLARTLVVGVVANAVRRQVRGEDLQESLEGAQAYLGALSIAPRDAQILHRLLASVTPFDPAAVIELLLQACARACGHGHEGGARGFAELAYEAAVANRLDMPASAAAFALARIAVLQEAPWSARQWRAIARLHTRRAVRERFAGC